MEHFLAKLPLTPAEMPQKTLSLVLHFISQSNYQQLVNEIQFLYDNKKYECRLYNLLTILFVIRLLFFLWIDGLTAAQGALREARDTFICKHSPLLNAKVRFEQFHVRLSFPWQRSGNVFAC